MGLSEREKAILEFERSWWQLPGPKEVAIKQRFQLSAARYYQILGALVDSPEALGYDPMVVRRLRRRRHHRRRARFEGPAAESRPVRT